MFWATSPKDRSSYKKSAKYQNIVKSPLLRGVRDVLKVKNRYKKSAIKQLQEMLKETKEDAQLAILNYELFKMTGEKNYKIRALKLFEKLYMNEPNRKYQAKIEELKNGDSG